MRLYTNAISGNNNPLINTYNLIPLTNGIVLDEWYVLRDLPTIATENPADNANSSDTQYRTIGTFGSYCDRLKGQGAEKLVYNSTGFFTAGLYLGKGTEVIAPSKDIDLRR